MHPWNYYDGDELNDFVPDFSVDAKDVCPSGKGGHEFREVENDGKTQVLKCDKCGHLSVGFFKP